MSAILLLKNAFLSINEQANRHVHINIYKKKKIALFFMC